MWIVNKEPHQLKIFHGWHTFLICHPQEVKVSQICNSTIVEQTNALFCLFAYPQLLTLMAPAHM